MDKRPIGIVRYNSDDRDAEIERLRAENEQLRRERDEAREVERQARAKPFGPAEVESARFNAKQESVARIAALEAERERRGFSNFALMRWLVELGATQDQIRERLGIDIPALALNVLRWQIEHGIKGPHVPIDPPRGKCACGHRHPENGRGACAECNCREWRNPDVA